MAARAVTLHLPAPLYDQLQRRAEEAHRSVEAELLEVVSTAVPLEEQLPDDLSEAVSALEALNDDELWQSARTKLPEETVERLEELHFERQRRELTMAENEELSSLVRQYERTMLVRAHAAMLLKQRGYDVDPLVNPG